MHKNYGYIWQSNGETQEVPKLAYVGHTSDFAHTRHEYNRTIQLTELAHAGDRRKNPKVSGLAA